MQKVIEENAAECYAMDVESYDLIAQLTHSGELKKMKKKIQREDGRYDMCKAIQEMIEEGQKEGQKVGQRLGRETELVRQIRAKTAKGKQNEEIAETLEIDEIYVDEITSLLKRYPAYDDEQIARCMILEKV